MVRRWRERGEGQMGCLFGLVILLIGVLIAYKMIPVKVKAAEMRDIVQDEARAAGQHSDKRIMETILIRAQQLNLPIAKENVSISRAANIIVVDVKYTVPVVFPGYTYNWNFHHKAENPIF
jgi:hypothetical protein